MLWTKCDRFNNAFHYMVCSQVRVPSLLHHQYCYLMSGILEILKVCLFYNNKYMMRTKVLMFIKGPRFNTFSVVDFSS